MKALRDGPDGPWASFLFSVGTPLQKFRTFPASSIPVAVLPSKAAWCTNVTSGVCDARGSFDSGISTSWIELGSYSLPLAQYLSFDNPNGTYGNDVFTFGGANNDVQLAGQLITATPSRNIPIGLFGLARWPASVGSEPELTLLSNLKAAGAIASTSFSYTAGSVVRASSQYAR